MIPRHVIMSRYRHVMTRMGHPVRYVPFKETHVLHELKLFEKSDESQKGYPDNLFDAPEIPLFGKRYDTRGFVSGLSVCSKKHREFDCFSARTRCSVMSGGMDAVVDLRSENAFHSKDSACFRKRFKHHESLFFLHALVICDDWRNECPVGWMRCGVV